VQEDAVALRQELLLLLAEGGAGGADGGAHAAGLPANLVAGLKNDVAAHLRMQACARRPAPPHTARRPARRSRARAPALAQGNFAGALRLCAEALEMRAAALGGHDSAAVAQVGAPALPRAPGLLYR